MVILLYSPTAVALTSHCKGYKKQIVVRRDACPRTYLDTWISCILVTAGNNDVMRTKSYILLEIGDILHAVYTIPWNYETHDSDLK
jgi:hypothetical protein